MNQLYEQGRRQPWGNGVRIDYSDGWSDAIVTQALNPVCLQQFQPRHLG